MVNIKHSPTEQNPETDKKKREGGEETLNSGYQRTGQTLPE